MLTLALFVPVFPFALVLSDTLFQVMVMLVALWRAREDKLGTVHRCGRVGSRLLGRLLLGGRLIRRTALRNDLLTRSGLVRR